MAEFQYLDNTANPQANATVLNAGDYLVSPSGVYNAVLNSDGSFVVSYGNAPNTDPTLWSTRATIPGPYTVTNYPDLNDWTINGYSNGVYTVNDGLTFQLSGTTFQPSPTLPSFLQLQDNGVLGIYQGNNGIKNNPNESSVSDFTQGSPNNVISLSLQTITYDTAHAVYGPVINDATAVQTNTNSTPTQQLYPITLSLAYADTETFTWNMTESLSATLSSATKIGVPTIGETTNTVSVTGSASLSEGQSTTQTVTQTYVSGASITVPPDSTYQTIITGETQSATVPYTWSGTAFYANGISAAITGSGSVLEDTTGVFTTITTCVSTPGGCPESSPTPIPEPSTLVTVPMAFAAMLLLAAVRRRRTRGSSRSGFGMLTPA